MMSNIFKKKGDRKDMERVVELVGKETCVSTLTIAINTRDDGKLDIDVFSGGDRRLILQAITTIMNGIVADLLNAHGIRINADTTKEKED